MDIQSAYEFAKRLRDTARRAEAFGHNRQSILEELIFVAELYETRAEQLEMEAIIDWQRELVEAA
jgi:hypothetical protein